jgi:hypothetical protein
VDQLQANSENLERDNEVLRAELKPNGKEA